ncbi:MAG: di- and tricarboxylate transporter [Candidatus Hydrogenedentota bacterium]
MNVQKHKVLGFIAGPTAFAVILSSPLPDGMTAEGQRVGAVAVLMAIWWISEAIAIPATALLPLALMPLLGVASPKDMAGAYGDPTVFLFAGGFFMAAAMQKWNLHERIALNILSRTGTNPAALVGGFMIATALLSMWISNTATAVMMAPIGIAVIQSFRSNDRPERVAAFATAIMLGIAYAASIGGMATLVGTPPNLIFVGQLRNLYPQAPVPTFGQWILIGLPLLALMLPLTWAVLVFVVHRMPAASDRSQTAAAIAAKRNQLGPIGRGEMVVLCVVSCAALAWIFRADLDMGFVIVPGWSRLLPNPALVDDSTVAMLFAALLFVLPIHPRKGEFALDWETARTIPWGVLMLFGGGLAIAKGFAESGLVSWMGERLSVLGGLPPLAMILAVCVLLTFVTEVTSNTATTSIMLPILAAAAASSLQVHPFTLMIPATLSASCAFMLPVATPPNALVFGSGYVSVPQMARAGFLLNWIGVAVIGSLTYFLVPWVFNLDLGTVPDWANVPSAAH